MKYWRRKEYSVKRIAGKDSRTGSRRRGTTAKSDVASEVSAILHKLVRMPDHEESDVREEQPEEEGMETVSEDQMIPEADSEEEYEEEPVDGDPEDSEEEIDPKEDYEEEDPDLIFEESPEDPSEEFSEEELSEEEFSEDVKEECTGEEAAEETREDSEAETAAGSEPAQVQDTESADLNEEEIEEDAEGADVSSTEEEPQGFVPDPDEITAIVSCIGMENLAELHNQLIQFYGDDGKDVYLSLKSGTLSIDKKDWDKEEKFLYYCALIFRHSDVPAEELSEENISEFAQFLLGAENKRKNLNSLRYALLKHYGKEKGRRYYFMLKPYVKALNQM